MFYDNIVIKLIYFTININRYYIVDSVAYLEFLLRGGCQGGYLLKDPTQWPSQELKIL